MGSGQGRVGSTTEGVGVIDNAHYFKCEKTPLHCTVHYMCKNYTVTWYELGVQKLTFQIFIFFLNFFIFF